jgi:hypothetical protein
MDDWLLLGLLGVVFLALAGVIELRARQQRDPLRRLRTASAILAVIGLIELVLGVLLRFV